MLKTRFIYNHGHNILRLFHVLSTFYSPQIKLNVIISNKHGIYKLLHELLNDLRLRIAGEKERSEKYQNLIEL